jgi:hypothetical protein
MSDSYNHDEHAIVGIMRKIALLMSKRSNPKTKAREKKYNRAGVPSMVSPYANRRQESFIIAKPPSRIFW